MKITRVYTRVLQACTLKTTQREYKASRILRFWPAFAGKTRAKHICRKKQQHVP